MAADAASERAPSDKVLARLLSLHPKLIDLSLDRVLRLLGQLGDPHKKLAPVIHVAGTNGKGSVVAYLRAVLEASGRRCHVYTSPHLVRFHERIRLAGELISEGALVGVLEECERENAGASITFFEITTCAALLAFSRAPADAVLLEVGMGGRLDTTNVVDRPAVTCVTPVSMDHMDHLGDTLAKISGEKAGIFRPGVPAVLAPQAPDAQAVLEARARALGAPLYRAGRVWAVAGHGDGMRYRGRRWRLDLPKPALFGPHQTVNAGTAIACLELLDGFKIDEAHIRRGLCDVEWPARMQRLGRGPLASKLPRGWELWLDGGHNAGCGEALAEIARSWRDRPLYLIYGMLNTKAPEGFLKPLAPHVAGLRAVTIQGADASLPAEAAARHARAAGIDALAAPGVGDALDEIIASVVGPARVLICGSLYLAGVVLAENG
ncbi:MAG: bifunctional folylpolyglutamate synthase/dihydrofolate synthase [Rhodospirillales bacterium]